MEKGNTAKTARQGRHMAAAKKDVAVQEEAKNTLPAAYDYGDDAGAGFEGTSRDDFTMPFLYILQSNSPIVEQGLVEAARPGVLLNSASQEMFPADQAKQAAGIVFVPCYRQHIFVEWKPNRGGFVAQHEIDSEVVAKAKQSGKFGELKVGENDLTETFYIYGLIVKTDGLFEPIVVPFTSTKIKQYKQLMTRVNSIRVQTPGGLKQPPLYAHRLRIRTVRQENDKGAFFNFVIEFDGNNAVEARLDPASELYAEARAFYDNCRSGIAKPNYESADRSTEGGVVTAGVDETLPF